MSTSQRTFNQVKSILGKLDQRIDTLRSARTTDRLLSLGGAGLSTTVGAGGEAGTKGPVTPGVIGPSTVVGGAFAGTTGEGTRGPVSAANNPGPTLSTTVGGGVNAAKTEGAGKPVSEPARSIYGRATPIRPTGA